MHSAWCVRRETWSGYGLGSLVFSEGMAAQKTKDSCEVLNQCDARRNGATTCLEQDSQVPHGYSLVIDEDRSVARIRRRTSISWPVGCAMAAVASRALVNMD